jgi:hypothetical protein
MRARLLKVGCFAGTLVVVGLAFWRPAGQEPEQDGHPLSYWLDQLVTGAYREGPIQTVTALKAIGRPAARKLVQYIALTDSSLRRRYTDLRGKLPASVNGFLPAGRPPASHVRMRAMTALIYMGPEAREELPELVLLLNHPDEEVRILAANVIARMVADARPALLEGMNATSDSGVSNFLYQTLTQIKSEHRTEIAKRLHANAIGMCYRQVIR